MTGKIRGPLKIKYMLVFDLHNHGFDNLQKYMVTDRRNHIQIIYNFQNV